MTVPYVSRVEHSPCFTKAAAAAMLLAKEAFIVVIKKDEITADTSLNKKQVGILYTCKAVNL